jgi:hypothetical protein
MALNKTDKVPCPFYLVIVSVPLCEMLCGVCFLVFSGKLLQVAMNENAYVWAKDTVSYCSNFATNP